MKLNLLIPMAVCLLGVTACEKNSVDPGSPLQANSEMNSSIPNTVCDVISFKDVNGFITHVNSDGGFGPIAVTSINGSSTENMARVFNSATAKTTIPALDPDLFSTTLGNILISQDASQLDPNDYAGRATFTFDFGSASVIAKSLTVIDVEEGGTIKLYSGEGGTQIGGDITITAAGDGETRIIDLGSFSNVGFIQVTINGSGGLDNLEFCREVRQPHCNYTQGYWKNHPEVWAETSLTISGQTYTQGELLTILKTPVRGNGLIALMHQLIAAKLNVDLDGGDPTINEIIANAEALINGQRLPGGSLSTSVTSQLTAELDAYNNSNHCD